MRKKYKDYKEMTVGEGLITALEQAVDYEKDKKITGVTSRKVTIGPGIARRTAKNCGRVLPRKRYRVP